VQDNLKRASPTCRKLDTLQEGGDLATAIDQKLLKVPIDGTDRRVGVFFQEGVDGASAGTVHLDLKKSANSLSAARRPYPSRGR
jgi:hypothetical protein